MKGRIFAAVLGGIFLSAAVCGLSGRGAGIHSLAVNYDAKIQEAQNENKEYVQKSEELQKEIEEMEQSREDTMAYIEKLDRKTTKLGEELEVLAGEIGTAKEELDRAEQELEAAEQTEQKQYDTMKKRIKYMYENGNQDYLDILFSSRDIGDLLNRAEYIEKIGDYDERMFEDYQRTRDAVEQKREEIEGKLSELEGMQEEQTAEKNALSELKKKKKEELKRYKEQLDISQDQAIDYAKKAAEAEAEVERLLKEKQAEIDRKNAAGGGGSGGGDGSLRWPLNVSGRISSPYGYRNSPTAGASTYHKGVDIAVPMGTEIVAAAAGTVVTATYSASAGNYVMISHGGRLYTVYMHCSRLAVSEGDTVAQGQVVGYAGSTGISTGSHLHFGVSKGGAYVDPMDYVSQP